MPWRDGGMGLTSVWHSSEALFLSAWSAALFRACERHNSPSVMALLEGIPVLSPVLTSSATSLHTKGIPEAQSTDKMFHDAGTKHLAQRWRYGVCARTITNYDCGADVNDVVTRKESGGRGAAGWLLTPQLPKHWLSDQTFVTSVRSRMHLRVFAAEGPCLHRSKPRPNQPASQCSCSRDPYGKHAFHCQMGGAIIARHNALRDTLAERVTEHTGLPATVEQHDHATGDERRPDLHYQNSRGETVHVDVAIVSPHMGTSNGDPRQCRPGAAISTHEALKRRKYPELRLMPAVCSHLGRVGNDLSSLFRSICSQHDLAERSRAISGMYQCWSTTLMHWNAHILATAGPLMPP